MSETIQVGANLCRHLNRAAKEAPNELAVAVQKACGVLNKQLEYQELNFAKLDAMSDILAHGLYAYGIKRGAKAVLMVTPSLE